MRHCFINHIIILTHGSSAECSLIVALCEYGDVFPGFVWTKVKVGECTHSFI